MTADFSYDPVTALDESTATGKTAEIFADIRATMGIPLITSIWRGLAGMGESLEIAWNATRPVYLSGHAEPALARMVEKAGLPVVHAPAPTQFACAGIGSAELQAIRTIVDAYNRSNGLNMVALAALTAPASGSKDEARPRALPTWGAFPSLLAREEIDANTWDLIRHINAFGAPGIDAHVATLWRHLGRWPSLLALVYAALAPAHADGSVAQAANRMVELAQIEGARLAPWCNDNVALPAQAHQTIARYVTSPGQVARMVTIGHALADWLPRNGQS